MILVQDQDLFSSICIFIWPSDIYWKYHPFSTAVYRELLHIQCSDTIAFVSKICFVLLAFLCQYHAVLTTVRTTSLPMLFLWKFGLILFGSWHFPMKFRISLSIPTMKMFPDWGCNKSMNQFAEDWPYIFFILSLPVH